MKYIINKLYRKLFITLLLALVLVISSIGLAQESSPAASPTPGSSIDELKIQQLKDKLATKVAELRENQTRGFLGEIASLSKTSFTLVTSDKEIKVRLSEDTLVSDLTGTKKTDKKIQDLKNLQTAGIIGLYDDQENILSAKIVMLQNMYKIYVGVVALVDKDNATLTLNLSNGSSQAIDYERATKADEFVKDEIKKSGLSRISAGDRLLVWGVTSEDDNQKISAVKILRLPKELFGETQGTQTATPSATPDE